MSALSPITPPAEEAGVVAGLPSDAPVTMVNLLRFKQPDGLEHYYREAFLSMVTSEEYRVAHGHRAAALDRAELIATSPF